MIMANTSSPLISRARIPPPDCKNLFIEYFTVNLDHCFSLIDLLPPDCNLFNLSLLAQFDCRLIYPRTAHFGGTVSESYEL